LRKQILITDDPIIEAAAGARPYYGSRLHRCQASDREIKTTACVGHGFDCDFMWIHDTCGVNLDPFRQNTTKIRLDAKIDVQHRQSDATGLPIHDCLL
jgi:hypothetical protein